MQMQRESRPHERSKNPGGACGTHRLPPCRMESLEGRFMMDSAFGQLVSGFVRAPVGDLYHRGPVIAYEGQHIYNNHPPHEAPPPVVDHGLDALTP